MAGSSQVLLNANQSWRVTAEGTINAVDKKKIMPGGQLDTLTPPKMGDGADKILVRYNGKGRPGEVPNGSKFWVKCAGLASKAERIK